jgi:phosphoribosylanthranilate isomerase
MTADPAAEDRPDGRSGAARVKICGVTTDRDLQVVAAAGADAVGIVVDVSVDTPREVSRDRARKLIAAAPPFLTTTAVTMAGTPAAVRELVAAVGPDVVQVHGHEAFDVDDLVRLREDLPARLVAAVDAGTAGTTVARRYDEAGAVDAVLVDSLDEAGGGGTGRTHDWAGTRALAAELSLPVVLAGGLTPDNVAAAVREVRPFAVDVASGVEATGGEKDPEAVRAFVAAAGRGLGPSPNGDAVDASAAAEAVGADTPAATDGGGES